jgi:hypothetical protein
VGRMNPRCACGHVRTSHAKGGNACRACPCVGFNDGATSPGVSLAPTVGEAGRGMTQARRDAILARAFPPKVRRS